MALRVENGETRKLGVPVEGGRNKRDELYETSSPPESYIVRLGPNPASRLFHHQSLREK
jgi:hypothetical protein